MSWDIFLFNTPQKIDAIEAVEDELLAPTDFDALLRAHFGAYITENDGHCTVRTGNFEIDYFRDEEPSGTKMISPANEQGLFELVILARMQGWQLFDTGSGAMIDLDDPGNNGYKAFQSYLQQVTESRRP